MRLKNIPGSRETIAASDLVIHEPEKHKGAWREEKRLVVQHGPL